MRRTLPALALAALLCAAPASAHIDPADERYENTLAKDFIMDAPWRVIDAQTTIPITVIIKDCDEDDVRDLHWIRAWDETSGDVILWDHDFGDETIGNDASEHNYWTYITKVTEGHPSLADGTPLTPANLGYAAGDHIDLRVSIYYRDDWFNYTETRHLRVHVGSGPFPWPEDWYGGDVHYHTMYTNNIYEWGAPLPAVKQTALAMGLHWLTATDHSCDLDETGDGTYSYATHQWEFTIQDTGGAVTAYRDITAAGGAWAGLGADVAELDSPSFRLYRAVELNLSSIDPDSWDKTLHCLVYNDGYIHSPDSGAPGERPVSPDLHGALGQITGDGFAYGAHPISDLSAEFLGFDFGANGAPWGDADIAQALTHEPFRGLQSFNTRVTVTSNDQNDPWSDFDAGNAASNPYPGELLTGIAQWDAYLAADLATGDPRRLFLAGGSDAHGDFNYSTHMSLDDYAEDNAIGKVQTVAYVPGEWSPGDLPPVTDILAAYRAGRTVVTDGPFLELGVDVDADGDWTDPDDLMIADAGDLHPSTGAIVRLRWASLPEFGGVATVRLIAVAATGSTELTSFTPGDPFDGDHALPLASFGLDGRVALRAELLTADGGAGHRAYTNPIWLNLDETVGVGDGPSRPGRATSVPNPFNPRTEIRFELADAGRVTVEIFDSRGARVRTLLSGAELPGGPQAVAWDGRDDAGRDAPAGSYQYRVTTGAGAWTGKMSLVR